MKKPNLDHRQSKEYPILGAGRKLPWISLPGITNH